MAGHNITWEQPSHHDLINVTVEDGYHRAFSLVSLPAGATFASLLPAEPAEIKRFTTVQTGVDSHFELKHDLVFVNHSCRPSVEFDTSNMVVRVAQDRDLKAGDELTFFYPSSEWDMDEPFSCQCASTDSKFPCFGQISGAKNFNREKLKHYFINNHIHELLDARGKK